MKHSTSSDCWVFYEGLPQEVRELADKNFDLLKQNHRHTSLPLKRIDEPWSAPVGIHYRAIEIDAPDGIQWNWIGSHADDDKFMT